MPMGWGIDATIWVARWVSGAAGQCLDDAAPADRTGHRAGRARRVVAVPVAGALAALGNRRDRGRPRDDAADPPARHRARRFRPVAGGARARTAITTSPPAPRRSPRSFLVRETGAELLPWPAGGRRRGPRLHCRRGPLLLYRARPAGGAGDRARPGLPVACDDGRRDRRAGAGRVRLPLADPGRRPHRQLAPRRDRAVARPGGIAVESANAEPRRPALGPAPGLGARARAQRGGGRAPSGSGRPARRRPNPTPKRPPASPIECDCPSPSFRLRREPFLGESRGKDCS